MTSIYLRALGSEFDRLQPGIQERFGFTSADGRSAIGRRTMENVWHGRFYTLPFLYVGTWRNIMFPERGQKTSLSRSKTGPIAIHTDGKR